MSTDSNSFQISQPEFQRTRNIWKIIALIAALLLILISLALVYILSSIFGVSSYVPPPPERPIFANVESPSAENKERTTNETNASINPDIPTESPKVVIEKEHVDYVLYNLQVYELHNPPFSSRFPVIELDIDGKKYYTEIKDGYLITNEGQTDKEDIRIFTTSDELVKFVNSNDVPSDLLESINNGDSSFQLVSDEKTLLLKGYINLYNNLVDEDSRIVLSPKTSNIRNSFLLIFILIIMLIIIFVLSYKKIKEK